MNEKIRQILREGVSSNLSPELYRLVRTPQFKAWFGDWENDPKNASKVLDDNGEPLLCYHQTSAENKKSILDSGLFLDGKERAAKNDYTTPYGFFFKNHERNIGLGDSHLAVFLNIRNPLYVSNRENLENYVTTLNKDYSDVIREISRINITNDKLANDLLKQSQPFWSKWREDKETPENIASIDAFKAKVKAHIDNWGVEIDKLSIIAKKLLDTTIKQEGFDGVLLRYDAGSFGRETDTKIVFKRNQIKLADLKNTTFTLDSDDIRNENIELFESLKRKVFKEYLST